MNQSATWNTTEAQNKFPQLLEAVNQNPQLITDDQGEIVAAVIEIETFQKFLNWNQQANKATIADAFTILQELCLEENYTLETPARIDRTHPFSPSM